MGGSHDHGAWRGALALWLLGTPLAAAEPAVAPPPAPLFTDETASSGLDFLHFNGMSGELYAVEVAGAGGGVFDYDGDGDLDLYLVQGTMLGPGKTLDQALFPPRQAPPLTDRLYRNDLVVGADGSRRLRFTDVTAASGLAATGYGMGVAAGDYDDDGDIDLYVTNFGPNQLWQNQGDGTFRDVTAASGTGEHRWSVGATFFDYDRDGHLDLYVTNYVDFSFANHKVCRKESGARDYCGPLSYEPLPDRLFHNRGDGTFEDVTVKAGVAGEYGAGLGAVAADFDGDGWADLYVANDMSANQMWMNLKDGTFRNEALLAGNAVDGEGHPQASMGVDAADFDGDGDEDLFMTHLDRQTNTLYLNDGHGFFRDVSFERGVGAASWEHTAFGTAFLDYDNDGRLDLLAVCGAVYLIPELVRRGDPFPLHETNQLFHNEGGGRFVEVTAAAGPVFALSEVSRGAAFGDLDNDGDTDVLLTNNNGPARILVNGVGQDRRWIGLRLVGGPGRRDMLGARVAVLPRGGGAPLWRRVRTDGSYGSANDPRVVVGLGETPAVERLEVHWPDGSVEVWKGLATGRYHLLRQGTAPP